MTVTWTEPTATDNSGMMPNVTQSHRSGDSFPVGTTQVTYTFTDQAGNEATCLFSVTIVIGQDSDPPVVTGCLKPLNITIPVGSASMTVTWAEPTATDNSGLMPTVTQSHQPGDNFSVGMTLVTYAFTDLAGNEAMCVFMVTLVEGNDTEPPVITKCPQSFSQNVAVGTVSTNVTWTEPTATDNSGLTPTVTQSHRSSDSFPVGITQVTYIFTDQAGNEAMCLFIITIVAIEDNTPPMISNCPTPVNHTVPTNTSSRVVTWQPPTSEDDSGQVVDVFSTHQSGDSFRVGETQVVYIFTDQAGNSATCIFTVTIVAGEDTTPPTVNGCPVSQNFTVPSVTTSLPVTWAEPTAIDDSGMTPTVTQSHRPGDNFSVGVTEVTYTFTDMAGNEAMYVAQDTTSPVISSCPDTVNVILLPGRTSTPVSWTEPTATDNSGLMPNVTQSHQPGDNFTAGPSQVAYTFTDQAGNEAMCIFTVMVIALDSIPPVIKGCPKPSTYTIPMGTTSIDVTWMEPTATDNSGMIPTVTKSHQPGDSFPIGITQVSYTFTDLVGNQATCIFVVTVDIGQDTIAPVISSCPDTINVILLPGMTSTPVSWTEPTATDNSGLMPNVTQSHQPGDNFTAGPSQVAYKFTDQARNEAMCIFTVMVIALDSIPPVIQRCPEPSTYTIPMGTTSIDVTWVEPTATDNSGMTLTVTKTHQPGGSFPIGITQVSYTFTDLVGNEATCTFLITVDMGQDTIAPVISSCPDTINVILLPGMTSTPVSWTEPTATDNSGLMPNVTQSHQPGDNLAAGPSQVAYTFTDQAGNEAMCIFTVMVIALDSIPPVIQRCPKPSTYTIPMGTTSIDVTWVEPTATDNSGMTPTVTKSHQPGDSFPIGITKVSYTFTDLVGNQATCTFSVTVVVDMDTTPPVITGCPESRGYDIPIGTKSRVVTWAEPTASDNSGMTLALSQSHRPGDSFPVGTTQVTYTFTDIFGNRAMCNFTITIALGEDTAPPNVSGCPEPLNFTVSHGILSGRLTWIEPTATDNSGMTPNVTQSHKPGDMFFVGVTQVNYIFTDMAANQAVCSFNVTVALGEDTTPPNVSGCPEPLNFTVSHGILSGTLTWIEPTATDNSGMTPNVTKSHQPGDMFFVGVTQVIYVFTDMAANQAVCSFNVTVALGEDTTPPNISGCPEPLNFTVSHGILSGTLTWIEPTATDNSGMTTNVTKSHQPGDMFFVGVTQVNYVFTDMAANQAVCSFNVTVEPTTTDNSGLTPTVSQSHQSGESFQVGMTQVVYTFTDMFGNVTACSFTVTIVEEQDIKAPVVTGCPEPLPIVIPLGTSRRVVTWTEPTATDNSGMTPTVTQSHRSGDSFPVGTTQVTYTFADMAGNTARCTFNVLIVAQDDTTAPMISDCPDSFDILIPLGMTSTTVTWIAPTATDNSGLTPTVTQSHQPGDSFPVGTTQVSYTFTDISRNEAICTFTVTIEQLLVLSWKYGFCMLVDLCL
ncbi:hyalin-like [Amphiura filiformis]|uniref:hyalin-like n=1 Tax=Amphiura filiformis TaxID=82378 RepID=UPI003B21FC43